LIGGLPEELHDRSIRIRLQRRKAEEKVTSFRAGTTSELAGQCARWTDDNWQWLANDPAIPDQLENRVADNWCPLFAIADVIGGEWPDRLRAIATQIVALEANEDPSPGAQLLSAIREYLGEREWVQSSQLASHCMMTGKMLATKLKPYDIEPHQIRIKDRVERGYWARDFADAFARYLAVPFVPDVPVTGPVQEDTTAIPSSETEVASGTSGTSGTRKASIGALKRRV
jgi:hypothetical protein